MGTLLGSNLTAGIRGVPRRSGPSRSGERLRSAVQTGVLAGLLLAATISVLVGAPAVLMCAVVGAWLSLAAIVGPRNVLDAGCYFMLVIVGVVVVGDLATTTSASVVP